jgi:hypothetical protein
MLLSIELRHYLPDKLLAFVGFLSSIMILMLIPSNLAFFSLIPFVLMVTKGVKISIINGVILSFIWIIYILIILSPLFFYFKQYLLLFVYIPIGVVFWKEPHEFATKLFVLIEYIFWDIPLLIWILIFSILDARALQVVYNKINNYYILLKIIY